MWVFGLASSNLLSIIVIAVAKLVKFQVGVLAVGIALDTLQTTKEKSLTHHTQVLAKWVHDLHTGSQSVCFQSLVVTHFGERVIENLIEALRSQLLRDTNLHCYRIRLLAVAETSIQFLWELHIIESIDTQDILYHVALTLHIYTVARYTNAPHITILIIDFYLKCFEDSLNQVFTQFFTNKCIGAVNIEFNWEWSKFGLTLISNLHGNLATSYFLNEQCTAL